VSVIPITIKEADGKTTPTVVQTQEDFQKVFGTPTEAVLILNLDVTQLENQKSSNVSYDLRIGSQYRDHRRKHANGLPENGTLTLKPGSAIIIETEESVHFPASFFGIIAPKVTRLQHGLSTTFSKIDPGYHGPLLITLFNLGQTVCTINRKDTFCALTLFKVMPPARLYGKGPQRITAQVAKRPWWRWWQVFNEWLRSYHVTILFWLVVAEFFRLPVELLHIAERLWQFIRHFF